jgi:hypothetical protein
MIKNKKINKGDWIGSPVRLLSLDDACHYLSCSSDLLEDLIAMGKIPIIRLGLTPNKGRTDHRKRWVDIKDLDAFIESRKERIGCETS